MQKVGWRKEEGGKKIILAGKLKVKGFQCFSLLENEQIHGRKKICVNKVKIYF